jgi:tRNA G37 N-methylase TrmD
VIKISENITLVKMFFRIFTLHPEIFKSFLDVGLIARGIEKGVISVELINWREKYGVGGYKQVDDRPYGGGQGMVLQVEPVYQALKEYDAISDLYKQNSTESEHFKILPNNSKFFSKAKNIKKATILLTPRGYPLNQKIIQFLSEFESLNILCGRYEGFDERVNDLVDMEISVGNYILNGGEVPAMALVEAVSRLIPDFISKPFASTHDSFSSGLNYYNEDSQYTKMGFIKQDTFQGFDDNWWQKNILPYIEHPQYTRPEIWNGRKVPKVLLEGNHKLIQEWRQNWYKLT